MKSIRFHHQLMCQSGNWLLYPHQVPRFDTPCSRYVGYTISMCGLKTNELHFRAGNILGLTQQYLGAWDNNCTRESLFFSQKKKKKSFRLLFLKNNIIIYKGKFSVYLFGGKIGWMENFGKKMRRKTFLSIFGWVGRKENK